jgi:hypothetical protein
MVPPSSELKQRDPRLFDALQALELAHKESAILPADEFGRASTSIIVPAAVTIIPVAVCAPAVVVVTSIPVRIPIIVPAVIADSDIGRGVRVSSAKGREEAHNSQYDQR